MIRTAAAAAVLLLLSAGCDFFGPDETLNDQLAPADRIRIDSVKNLTAAVTVFSACPDPCWLYSRSTSSQEDKAITMTFYKVRKENASCPDVTTDLVIPVSVRVQSAGTYTLRFTRSATATLDTTITF